MENEAQAEHVTDGVILGLHVLDVDDLRSDVPRCTTPHKEVFVGIAEFSQAEVGNDALSPAIVGSEDEVFWLEVTMHGLLGVHFLQALKDGVDGESGFVGLEFVLGLDFVVELSSFQKFDHDVERVFRFENLV